MTLPSKSTRNFLTFVNTTTIAYHQNTGAQAPVDCLPVFSGSVHGHQKTTSRVNVGKGRG